MQGIYDQVQRQVYWFLTATLMAIAATGLYLIRANRRLFAELASLSDGRRELAQQLIATRESTLRHLSRELHDYLDTDTTSAEARIKLFRLAWDVCCSAFGSRQVLYERYFGGNALQNSILLYNLYDKQPMTDWVRQFLEQA